MNNTQITITIRRPSDQSPNGYIGATYSNDPLPGEDWRRSGDLADGPHNSETVSRVIGDIHSMIDFGHRYGDGEMSPPGPRDE